MLVDRLLFPPRYVNYLTTPPKSSFVSQLHRSTASDQADAQSHQPGLPASSNSTLSKVKDTPATTKYPEQPRALSLDCIRQIVELLRSIHRGAYTESDDSLPQSLGDPSRKPAQLLRQPNTASMGGQISKMMGKIFGSKEMRLLMLGLDAAGKTTILYKLKLNQDVTTIPTVGFNVETVTYKNVKFNVWDVGGQDKIRPLWRHYFSGTQGLIFVIDSNDRARIDEARQELHRIILDREMKEALLLVFANKQDIPGAMTPTEVTEKLRLGQLKERMWYVVPSCATTGEGLFEGLGWLSNNVKTQPKSQGR